MADRELHLRDTNVAIWDARKVEEAGNKDRSS